MFELKFDQRQVNDAINFIENIILNVRKVIDEDLGKAAADAVQTARSNAHVITGNMRNSVSDQRVGEMHYKVTAEAEYSGFENARGGDHAFFDMTVKEIRDKYPDIIVTNIKKLVTNKQ